MSATGTNKMPSADAAAEECSTALCRHSFNGDFDAFQQAFSDYLQRFGAHDPDGRKAIQKSLRGSSVLSFRSRFADLDKNYEDMRSRWSAWLSIMPLDLQVCLIVYESSSRLDDARLFDCRALKWESFTDTAPPPPDTLAPANVGLDLVSMVHCHASQLMAWGKWDALAEWMDAAKIHAREQVSELFVHYTTAYSHGSTRARAVESLPFWAVGVFVGATDPQFWQVMERFGGPASSADLLPDRSAAAASVRPLAPPPGPGFWDDPLLFVEPLAALHGEAIASIRHTTADWARRAMETSLPAPDAPRSPLPRM